MRSLIKWWSGLLLTLLSTVLPVQAQRSQLKPLEVRIGGGGGVSGSMLDLVPRVEMLPHLGAMGYVGVLLTNQKYTGIILLYVRIEISRIILIPSPVTGYIE